MGQYDGKLPFSLVYVLKLLITAIRAIGFHILVRVFRNTLIPSVKMTLTMKKTIKREVEYSTAK